MKQHRIKMRIFALALCFTLLGSYLPYWNVSKAVSIPTFTYDGTNEDDWAGQTTIFINCTLLDMQNQHTSNLVNLCKNTVTTIIFEDGVSQIGAGVFEGFTRLSSVTLDSKLLFIGKRAFANTALTSIRIPAKVHYIGSEAFVSCNNLTTIYVDGSNTIYSSYDGVLFSDSSKKIEAYPAGKNAGGRYKVPANVTAIGPYAFEGALIKIISFPNVPTFTSIGDSAFLNAKINTILSYNDLGEVESFPEAYTVIGPNAFRGTGLGTVKIYEFVKFVDVGDDMSFEPYDGTTGSGVIVDTVPTIRVQNNPLAWTQSAGLVFAWTGQVDIAEISLDNIDVTVKSGQNVSNSVVVTQSKEYLLRVDYYTSNRSINTYYRMIDVTMVDSATPQVVTYTLADDVVSLTSSDIQSGLRSISYSLNGDYFETYKNPITLKPGKNTIAVYATDNVGNVSATVSYVIDLPAVERKVYMNAHSVQLTKDKQFALSTYFVPADTMNNQVSYSSSNGSVATVNANGVVTGVRVGTAVITATASNGSTDKCTFVVTKEPVVTSKLSLYKGESKEIVISNSEKENYVEYATDNKSVATVDEDGMVTATGIGEATIITKIDTGVRVYTKYTVIKAISPKLIITTKPKSVKKGKKYTFRALRNGSSKSIKWSVNNKTIATINKTTGVLKALKKGTVYVKAKSGIYTMTHKLKVK